MILVDRSVRVKKAAHIEFDIAAAEGDTPGNLFLNQEEPTHQSTKGSIIKKKVVDSTNSYMYFMKVILEGVS